MSDVRTSRSRKSASEVLTSAMYVVVNTHGNAHLQIKGDREKEAEREKEKGRRADFQNAFCQKFHFLV